MTLDSYMVISLKITLCINSTLPKSIIGHEPKVLILSPFSIKTVWFHVETPTLLGLLKIIELSLLSSSLSTKEDKNREFQPKENAGAGHCLKSLPGIIKCEYQVSHSCSQWSLFVRATIDNRGGNLACPVRVRFEPDPIFMDMDGPIIKWIGLELMILGRWA